MYTYLSEKVVGDKQTHHEVILYEYAFFAFVVQNPKKQSIYKGPFVLALEKNY